MKLYLVWSEETFEDWDYEISSRNVQIFLTPQPDAIVIDTDNPNPVYADSFGEGCIFDLEKGVAIVQEIKWEREKRARQEAWAIEHERFLKTFCKEHGIEWQSVEHAEKLTDAYYKAIDEAKKEKEWQEEKEKHNAMVRKNIAIRKEYHKEVDRLKTKNPDVPLKELRAQAREKYPFKCIDESLWE